MDTASTATENLQGSSMANPAFHTPAEGSYEAYVLGLVPHWPHLRIVTDFMSSDHTYTPTPFTKITFKPDIRIIDVTCTLHVSSDYYTASAENNHLFSVDQLRQFLAKPSTGYNRRFIMVEDLSAEVIELLGSTFSLNPEFFAQHLSDWWTNHQGFSSSEHPLHQFGSSSWKLGFQHFKFQRAYEWQEVECMEDTRLWQPYILQGTKPEVLVGEGFSAFSPGRADISTRVYTGIYLFDRILDLRAPRLYAGTRSFCTRPAFRVAQPQLSKSAHQPIKQDRLEWHHKSLRDETAERILDMSESDLIQLANSPYPMMELDIPLRVLLSSWVLVANILNRKLCGIEDQIASNVWGDALSNAVFLNQLVKLRKHALESSSSLERTHFALSNNQMNVPKYLELQADTTQLISEFKNIAARGDTNSSAFLAKSAVEEAQKTCAQLEMMKRLTMLAFVFVPITSVATVLIIQDNWLWTKYLILAGLSIPITVLTLLLSREPRGLRSHQGLSEKKLAATPAIPLDESQKAESYKMPGGYL